MSGTLSEATPDSGGRRRLGTGARLAACVLFGALALPAPAAAQEDMRWVRTESPRETLGSFLRLRDVAEDAVQRYADEPTRAHFQDLLDLVPPFAELSDLSTVPAAAGPWVTSTPRFPLIPGDVVPGLRGHTPTPSRTTQQPARRDEREGEEGQPIGIADPASLSTPRGREAPGLEKRVGSSRILQCSLGQTTKEPSMQIRGRLEDVEFGGPATCRIVVKGSISPPGPNDRET